MHNSPFSAWTCSTMKGPSPGCFTRTCLVPCHSPFKTFIFQQLDLQYEEGTFTRVFYNLHAWSRASVPLKHSSFSAWTCSTRRGPSPGCSTCLVDCAPSSTAPSTSPSTPWAGRSSSGPSSRYSDPHPSIQ